MNVRMRIVLRVFQLAMLAAATVSVCELQLLAEEETQQPADTPTAVTTSDPEVAPSPINRRHDETSSKQHFTAII